MTSPGNADASAALRRFWGYDSFRPRQEQVIQSLLGGHDVCVIMPTGGGKSLCYQLPAAMSPGRTVIVISPLIALMQDQAAQLAQMGIPAAVLNSSLTSAEQTTIMRKAKAGEFRLLYLSPERLARTDTVGWLKSVPVFFFAIDEAHCISEWGHEFRPEYRLLSRLRADFPECPIAAFTASATRRVRHDIVAQLRLRDPHKYIASFHRANLRYVVQECVNEVAQLELLVQALRYHAEHHVIVYSPTIARVGETVDFLGEQGIGAIPYHGKMGAADRRRNQELWMSDEARVLVGTIAFGLGINKAAVRAVIHLALPQSIEQFYQEAGRAGRDGEPADCLLLWRKRDAGLLGYFADKITDAAERERAWQRYHEIRGFADSRSCRHRAICNHFGEKTAWTSCADSDDFGCDNCGYRPACLATTVTAKPRRARAFRTESVPPAVVVSTGTASASANPELREYLRQWRRAAAREQNLGAFVVLHDSALDDLCRLQPRTLTELVEVHGIGERKAERYGAQILQAIEEFRQGARAAAVTQKHSPPAQETIRLLAEGRTFQEIAQVRNRELRTVVSLVADMVERGDLDFDSTWLDPEKLTLIEAACARTGLDRLKPVKDVLPETCSYEDIRLVVAHLRRLKRERQSVA